MHNHSILFFTDNEALVHVINKQSCRDKTLMVFVRKLVFVCLDNNILFKGKHSGCIILICILQHRPYNRPQFLLILGPGNYLRNSTVHCFSLPITPATLALFIAYLFKRNYAASTVNTYISTSGYSLMNCQVYLTQCEFSMLFRYLKATAKLVCD